MPSQLRVEVLMQPFQVQYLHTKKQHGVQVGNCAGESLPRSPGYFFVSAGI